MKTVILSTALAVTASVAAAQAPACLPHADMVELFTDKLGMSRQSYGLADTMLMELYASKSSGAWVIIFSTASGISCYVTEGTAYTGPMPDL